MSPFYTFLTRQAEKKVLTWVVWPEVEHEWKNMVHVNCINISLSLYMKAGSNLNELLLKGKEIFWRGQKMKSIREEKPTNNKAKTQYNLQAIKKKKVAHSP